MYFVIYQGDLDKDPLDCGSEYFDDYGGAEDFAYRMRNIGLTCTIYQGIILDEELRARQYAAMEGLTALGQEMGLYDVSYEDNPLIRRKVDTDKEEIRIV